MINEINDQINTEVQSRTDAMNRLANKSRGPSFIDRLKKEGRFEMIRELAKREMELNLLNRQIKKWIYNPLTYLKADRRSDLRSLKEKYRRLSDELRELETKDAHYFRYFHSDD